MNPPPCTHCGRPRTARKDSPGAWAGVHGWCTTCARRWYANGCPGDGPPPPVTPAQAAAIPNAARAAQAAARAAEYARLRRLGYTPAQARMRLRVAPRTARTYETLMTRQPRHLAA